MLLGWWHDQNLKGRHLWPGISIGLSPASRAADETVNQIMVTRGLLPESPGVIHWSIGPLVNSAELVKAIADGPYRRPALVPPSPWLDKKAPAPPVVTKTAGDGSLNLDWTHPDPADVNRWVVYYRYGSQWNQNIHGSNVSSDVIPGFMINRPFLGRTPRENVTKPEQALLRLDSIAVSAVDRFGNESVISKIAVT